MPDNPEQRYLAMRAERTSSRALARFWELADAAPVKPAAKAAEAVHPSAHVKGEAVERLKTAWRGAKDIGEGAVLESVPQLAGGAVDAVNQSLRDVQELSAWIQKNSAPSDEIAASPEADLASRAMPMFADILKRGSGQVPDVAAEDVFQLPVPPEADTVTGGLIRGISRFLVGFAGAGKALGPAKAAGQAVKAGRAALQGAMADVAVFGANEARLSDLINQFPALRNPVTEYLASDPEDSAVEGKFKLALEGLIPGVAIDGLLLGLRAIRSNRAAMMSMAAPAEDIGEEIGRTVTREDIDVLLDDRWGLFYGVRAKTKTQPKLEVVPDEPSMSPAEVLAKQPSVVVDAGELYVNWGRINTNDDLKAVLRDVADSQRADIDEARRGVVTWRKTKRNAAQVDAWQKLQDMGERRGVLLNEAETLAVRQLWVSSVRKVKDLAAAAEIGGPSELFAFRQQMAIHSQIQKKVIAVRTEQARALQQWRIPAGEGREIARNLDGLLEEMGGEQVSRELARKVSMLARNGKDAELEVLAQGSLGLKTREALTSLWYAALLSSPHTHLRNTISNTAVAAQQLYERKAAEWIRQLKGGGEGVEPGEAMAMFYADIEGFKDALRFLSKRQSLAESDLAGMGAAWRGETGTVRARVGREPGGALSAERWNLDADAPWGRAMDFVESGVSTPTRLLAVEDELFKSFGHRRALHYQALRRASKEIRDAAPEELETIARQIAKEQAPDRAEAYAKELVDDRGALLKARIAELIEDPDEAMRIQAEDHAAYVTFTNKPAQVPDALIRSWQKFPVFGRLTMPFRRTPVNIATYALERTPFAPAIKSWREDIKAGGARADLAQARFVTGSALLAASMDLAMSGYIVGEGVSRQERASRQAQDIQPSSVRVKTGEGENDYRTLSFRGMEPVATTLGLASNIVEILANADFESDDLDGSEISKAIVASTFAVMNQLTSQQYMQGMANFFDMMSDPIRMGDRFMARTASSFVPNVLATEARAEDPYLREASGMVDSMLRKMPGYSKDLPFARDRWGRKRDRRSGWGGFYDAISPIYSKKQKTTPIDKAIDELDLYVGKPSRRASFDPAWAGNMLTRNSVSVQLRNFPKAYDRYQELQGNVLKLDSAGAIVNPAPMGQHDALNLLVSGKHPMSSIYAMQTDGPDGGRAQMIRQVRIDYQRAARKQLLQEFPELRDKVQRLLAKQRGPY